MPSSFNVLRYFRVALRWSDLSGTVARRFFTTSMLFASSVSSQPESIRRQPGLNSRINEFFPNTPPSALPKAWLQKPDQVDNLLRKVAAEAPETDGTTLYESRADADGHTAVIVSRHTVPEDALS